MTTDTARSAVARHQLKESERFEVPALRQRHFKLGRISVAGQIARGSGAKTRSISEEDPIWKLDKTEKQQQGHSSGNNRGQLVLQAEGRKPRSRQTGEQRCPITAGLADRDHCRLHDHGAEVDDWSGLPNVLGPMFFACVPGGDRGRDRSTARR